MVGFLVSATVFFLSSVRSSLESEAVSIAILREVASVALRLESVESCFFMLAMVWTASVPSALRLRIHAWMVPLFTPSSLATSATGMPASTSKSMRSFFSFLIAIGPP